MDISKPNFRNFQEENRLLVNIADTRAESVEVLARVRRLESAIKLLDPDFTSAINPNTYLSVGRR